MRQLAGYATLFLLLFALTASANHVEEYIQNYKDIAQREMKRSNIPASIILAQGIHESSWGRGTLAKESKNHFGIKCKDYWTGPTFYYEDDDYENGKLIKSCFRAYQDVEDSYIDHTDFLVESDRYQGLFLYDPTDYKNWAKGLKQCGYATDPHYASKLIRIIETHRLYLFDMITIPVMDAPVFYIPSQFLQQHTAIDPVVYTYEESVGETYDIPRYEEEHSISEVSNFNYQVRVESIPAQEEEEEPFTPETDLPVYTRVDDMQLENYGSLRYDLTDVMPNATSGDKRIQNLARKPRLSSEAGPR